MVRVYSESQSVVPFYENSTQSLYNPFDFLVSTILLQPSCVINIAENFLNIINYFNTFKMSTFDPIPYQYVPTVPRNKRATT
jgi:hypothetical protein